MPIVSGFGLSRPKQEDRQDAYSQRMTVHVHNGVLYIERIYISLFLHIYENGPFYRFLEAFVSLKPYKSANIGESA